MAEVAMRVRWMQTLVLNLGLLASSCQPEQGTDYETMWWATVDIVDEEFPGLADEVVVDWEATTVVDAPRSAIQRVPGCNSDRIIGCTQTDYIEEFDIYAHTITILETMYPLNRCQTMAHESLHGLHYRLYGHGDSKHQNRLFWRDAGGKQSFEHRAKGLAAEVCVYER